MKRLLVFVVATAVGMVAAWAQRSDVNGDGIINSADVVCVYNDIINGEASGVADMEFTVNGVTFTMVGVEGGTFLMGCTSEQEPTSEDVDNFPIHNVTLSDYHIGQTEVTQALWKAVMGGNPSWFKGDNLPVDQVSWNDCQQFIAKLNVLTGQKFRLPTEAEWEYACRGGNKSRGYKYSGSNNVDDVAWHKGNSDYTTHRVATKQPNELGIFDMSGNVYEWCQDWYGDYSANNQTNPTGPDKGVYRIRRGGCWYNYYNKVRDCRSSCRGNFTASFNNYFNGFRLALTI